MLQTILPNDLAGGATREPKALLHDAKSELQIMRRAQKKDLWPKFRP
jgi:hypothetical protein